MLKLYVDCLSFMHASKSAYKKRLNEEGFVSAETIALAVAGVVIVGGLLVLFRPALEGLATRILGDGDGGIGGFIE